jgi:cell division protease FtsH
MLISLLKAFRSKGGEISNGEVVDKKEAFVQLFESFYFDESDRHGDAMSVNYFKSKDFLIGVMGLNDRIIPEDLMKKKILSCNVNELILLIAGLIKQAVVPKEVDLRHALIFVVGNLDEAYSMSRDLDPDMDADIMHELTKKITVAEIKEALLTRFRSEQVARLGNNHFIYRAFSSAQFREVIRRELARISAFANAELGWTINFSESIVDVIYSEGVISTQGTRPVYTTINNLVQSRIGKVAIGASRVEQNVASVDWSFNDNAFRFDFKDANQAVVASIGEKIELTMAKQRAPADPNVQAHVAVHESGHAILAALLLRIVPSVVVSRSASANSVGFCYVRFPKGMMTNDTLLKDISISLGGLAAEKIVFGEQFTSSGVGSDIAEASRLANNAIRRFGMGSDPIRLAAAMNAATQDYFGDTYSYEEESVRLVRDCMMVAEAILNRNKLLLLKMSEYLTRNSRMEMSVIEEFVTKYSTEDWVQESGFTQPEEYYEFDKVVESQLKELVEQQATSVLLTP